MASTSLTSVVTEPEIFLGKRKQPNKADTFVLHLSQSPEPNSINSDSDYGPSQQEQTLSSRRIIVNGKLVSDTKKRYKCTQDGCDKSYSKPSRLAEHERSHSGDRPFKCETCTKSYLRETHLQAHIRSHLPESARPLICSKENCGKRFWTSQHLRVHEDWHDGLNLLQCPDAGCQETFFKNHQLRTHLCSVHGSSSMRRYSCDHEGCSKSFTTNQHLRTHMKIHDDKRYACVHPSCLPGPEGASIYFSTWTALQHHIRTTHPPACSRPSCSGRTFSSQKGLRAHQKLHDQRDLEAEINDAISSGDESTNEERPRKKQRGGEIGRDWRCDVDGCGKDFKSKKALSTHVDVRHLGYREYICPHDTCQRAYGYKHLLRRHLTQAHDPIIPNAGAPSEEQNIPQAKHSATSVSRKIKRSVDMDIDTFTGTAYAKRAVSSVANAKALRCPYPNKADFLVTLQPDKVAANVRDSSTAAELRCEYAFSRAYDLRRHLKAVHATVTEKETIDKWVWDQKKGS